jgi:hypothetical protein
MPPMTAEEKKVLACQFLFVIGSSSLDQAAKKAG